MFVQTNSYLFEQTVKALFSDVISGASYQPVHQNIIRPRSHVLGYAVQVFKAEPQNSVIYHALRIIAGRPKVYVARP